MATTTRLPDGDGTGLAWTPKGGGANYVEVDEGIAGADDATTEVTENTTGVDDDHYTMQDMPADFDTAIEVDHILRGYQSGRVDDTCLLRVMVKKSNEVDGVTGGDTHNIDAVTSYTTLGDGALKANTANKAAWDSYKFRLHKSKIASAMADAVTFFCTAVEVVINYNVTGAVGQPTQHRTQGIPTGSGSRDRPGKWN